MNLNRNNDSKNILMSKIFLINKRIFNYYSLVFEVLVYPNLNENKIFYQSKMILNAAAQSFNKDDVIDISRFKEDKGN